MRFLLSTVVAIVAGVVLSSSAWTQVPEQIPVQGQLTDADGLIVEGPVDIGFGLFDVESGGTEIWFEEHQDVELDGGFFTLFLGDVTPLDMEALLDAEELWLEMTVNGETLSRVQLGSVPFALEAAVAGQVGGLTADHIQPLLGEACTTGTYLRGWDSVGNAPICASDELGDPLTAAQVDAIVADNGYAIASQLDDGTPGTTPISWNDLSDIPADIANGDQDTQLDEAAVDAFVANNGYAIASQLDDGTPGTTPISWNDLSDIPADIANGDQDTQLSEAAVDAFVANNGYAIASQLNDGTPGTTPISWNDLSDIPADIANGDQVNTYTAGTGLALDSFEFSAVGSPFANVVVVATTGGDFNSIQDAIDSIGDAAADKPYLVWVGPGVYSEVVTLIPHVHLQGAGQDATIIEVDPGNTTSPPTQGAIVLAPDSSVRDLTAVGTGSGTFTVAILAPDSTLNARVQNVTALARDPATVNRGLSLQGTTSVTLDHVTALALGGGTNVGMNVEGGAEAVVLGGFYSADCTSGGSNCSGIRLDATGGRVELFDVAALASGTGGVTDGLFNHGGEAVVHGGTFNARGGANVHGINTESPGTLEAVDVSAIAKDGSSETLGLRNRSSGTVLRGGSFVARGTWSGGIYNDTSPDGDPLVAVGVTALGEEPSTDNAIACGLWGRSGELRLVGGSFTGRGGNEADGIVLIPAEGTTPILLSADNIVARGEDGQDFAHGLRSGGDAVDVALRGSSLLGRGSATCAAALILNSGHTLTAERVTARCVDGTTSNVGLNAGFGTTTTIRQSVLEGADNSITSGGTVTVETSSLVGGPVVGPLETTNCVLVTRGTTVSVDGSTCP